MAAATARCPFAAAAACSLIGAVVKVCVLQVGEQPAAATSKSGALPRSFLPAHKTKKVGCASLVSFTYICLLLLLASHLPFLFDFGACLTAHSSAV